MTLILNNRDIEALISPSEFVTSLDVAYGGFAEGEGVCAPRIDIQSGQGTDGKNYQLGLAVGMSGKYAALRIKSDVVFSEIVEGRPRKKKYCVEPGIYMGLVMLLDRSNGALVAIMHDGLLQRMRVGADSALGARYMAREDASSLGILGSGGMARTHVAAISTVRKVSQVKIFSPTKENREVFAREVSAAHGIEAIAVDDPVDIFVGTDIVSSCASAIGPVIFGENLRPGQHVTCIGGTLDATASARIDVALRFGLAPAPAEAPTFQVEDECLTFAESGAKSAHGGTRRYAAVPDERRVSFAELLADPTRGRTRADQITFSERGNIHGVQFSAVAGLLYEKARDAGAGQELPADLFLQTIRN
jgi:ornithine cyclodeaminase/alanine dehydrogenase-like protein (mu-crystallin family)